MRIEDLDSMSEEELKEFLAKTSTEELLKILPADLVKILQQAAQVAVKEVALQFGMTEEEVVLMMIEGASESGRF